MSTAVDIVLPAILEQRALNKKEAKFFKQVAKSISKKKLEDQSADEALIFGYMSEQQGNDALAIEGYSEAISKNPSYEAAYKFRGAAHIRSKDFVAGEQDLLKALELDAQYTDAELELASMKYEAGAFEEAQQRVEKVLELEPENAIAHALKGSILDKHEKYDEALASFDKAIELEPEDGQLVMQRGIVRFFAGLKEEALEDMKACRRLSGGHHVLTFNFGLILVTMEGMEKEAYRNFEKAFKKDPHMLKNYLASAQDFEADRLVDILRAAIKRIEGTTSEGGSYYRDELLDLLKSKLP